MTGNSTPKSHLKKQEIDRLVYSYKEKDVSMSRKKFLNQVYDQKDGSKLYTPRINRCSPAKHMFSLKEIEQWKSQSKDFLVKLRQIFDFLDKTHLGEIFVETIDYENIHPDLLNLLDPILASIETHKGRLDFSTFFDLIEANNLVENVNFIFDTINRQPLINPKPLKDKNFKFTD